MCGPFYYARSDGDENPAKLHAQLTTHPKRITRLESKQPTAYGFEPSANGASSLDRRSRPARRASGRRPRSNPLGDAIKRNARPCAGHFVFWGSDGDENPATLHARSQTISTGQPGPRLDAPPPLGSNRAPTARAHWTGAAGQPEGQAAAGRAVIPCPTAVRAVIPNGKASPESAFALAQTRPRTARRND